MTSPLSFLRIPFRDRFFTSFNEIEITSFQFCFNICHFGGFFSTNGSEGHFGGFIGHLCVRGQNISMRNTALDSASESNFFYVSHELTFYGHFSFLSHWGGGDENIWAVNVLLAARD